jgi:hypothetical protein
VRTGRFAVKRGGFDEDEDVAVACALGCAASETTRCVLSWGRYPIVCVEPVKTFGKEVEDRRRIETCVWVDGV